MILDYSICSEELALEYVSAYGQYLDIWERIYKRHASTEEQHLLDKAVLFNAKWIEVETTRTKIGRPIYKLERQNRIELPLQLVDAHEGNDWGSLICALSPQSVRDACEATKGFEIENYKTRFYALENRGSWFKSDETSEPSEDFENFKSYYASWHACLVEAVRKNHGLIACCW